MAPKVRTLDELNALLNPVYEPQKQAYNQQINQTQEALPGQEAAVYAARDNAFKAINQQASNKGLLFSGFTPDQQAKYSAEKFAPAITNMRSKVQDNIGRLQSALLGLDSDQRKEVMNLREGDQGKLDAFNTEQDRRKYEQEQQRVAYEREMQALQKKQSFEASQSSQAAPKPAQNEFLLQAFSGYKPAYEGGTPYYTEREVIPALMTTYGMTQAQAANIAYQYRKSIFGERAGSVK